MNDALRRELLSLREEDTRVREELAADGSLYEGYHPKMEAVHSHNAARLREIVGEHEWPGASLVGADGAEADAAVAGDRRFRGGRSAGRSDRSRHKRNDSGKCGGRVRGLARQASVVGGIHPHCRARVARHTFLSTEIRPNDK